MKARTEELIDLGFFWLHVGLVVLVAIVQAPAPWWAVAVLIAIIAHHRYRIYRQSRWKRQLVEHVRGGPMITLPKDWE